MFILDITPFVAASILHLPHVLAISNSRFDPNRAKEQFDALTG